MVDSYFYLNRTEIMLNRWIFLVMMVDLLVDFIFLFILEEEHMDFSLDGMQIYFAYSSVYPEHLNFMKEIKLAFDSCDHIVCFNLRLRYI